MFKLLRSSRRQKKAKQEAAAEAERLQQHATTTAAAAAAFPATQRATSNTASRYRQLSESEREPAGVPVTVAGLPTGAARATVAVFDDLCDFDDVDDGVQLRAAKAATASVRATSTTASWDAHRAEQDINLAKTAANITRRNVAAATEKATPPSAKTNSAIKNADKVFTFGKCDADGINKFVAATTKTALSALGAEQRSGSQYEPTEWQGHKIENDRDNDSQQHDEEVLTTIGSKRRNIIDEKINSSNILEHSPTTTTTTTTAATTHTPARTAFFASIGTPSSQFNSNQSSVASGSQAKRNAQAANNSNHDNSNNDTNSSSSNSCSHTARANAVISAQVPATEKETEGAVKYRRHFAEPHVERECEPEKKRHSRLSLTLGLSGRSKSANDSNKESKRSDVGQSLRRSFFLSKNKGSEAEPSPEKLNVSQSVPTGATEEEEQLNRPNSKLFYKATSPPVVSNSVSNEKESIAAERKLKALQRGKEFLSDIFMARGRNHNRNRNQGGIQQQQQQTQQQQLKQSATSSATTRSHIERQRESTTTTTPRPMLGTHIDHASNGNPIGIENGIGHGNVTDWSQHSTHLEMSCDPARNTAHTITTYQMTMSNNSPKNFSQSNSAADRWEQRAQPPRRSNSAEHLRTALTTAGAQARARSEDPRAGERRQQSPLYAGARQESESAARLNGAAVLEQPFIRASNSERNATRNQAAPATATTANIKNAPGHTDDRAAPTTNNTVSGGGRTSATAHAPVTAEAPAAATSDGDATHQLNNLTECDRDNLLQHSDQQQQQRANACELAGATMGQTNAKAADPPASTRASTPRDFRESIITAGTAAIALPKITVVDYGDVECSRSASPSATGKGGVGVSDHCNGSPVEHEVFYDFDTVEKPRSVDSGVNITAVDEHGSDMNDEVFQESTTTTTDDAQRHKWSPPIVVPLSVTQVRHNYKILEDVPEQEEDEEDDDTEDEENEDEDEDDDEEAEEAAQATASQQQQQRHTHSAGAVAGNPTTDAAHNLDNELYQRRQQHSDDSPERSPLKSTNTSDSNLSTSYPDSGIGDSQASSSSRLANGSAAADNEMATRGARGSTPSSQQQQQQLLQQRLSFVRDGNSTDCDDTLLQYDDLEAESCELNNERLVCIESISLPDVVVESTTVSSAAGNSCTSSCNSSGEAIININGATGNSMGNVHFIPIHMEADHKNNSSGNGNSNSSNGTQKRRSVDDSVIGSNGKTFSHMNAQQSKPTIEIIEEDTYTADYGSKLNGMRIDGTAEKLKRELNEQKSRFNVQLEDAQKNVHNLQSRVSEMQTKIQKLEQELATKTWNVERLQSELSAAQKDDEYVRKRLKMLENEKISLRSQYDEYEDEFKKKHDELEQQYQELEEKYQSTQNLARSLQTQLAAAQTEAEEWRKQVERIRQELEEQVRLLRNALENSEAERKINEDKWQKEFEMLRTQNRDREETLMTDCEWQLRQVQKQFKDKLDKSEHTRRTTQEQVELLEDSLLHRQQEVDSLRIHQSEVTSLRGVVTEQENSIETLIEQIENLKAELEAANKNLEEQINAVKKIKYMCDNALCDKERHMIYRIDEVRNEAAAFWEDKLYTEMTRLKNELESVYVDDRREALDKLQTEHIEELRALTTRYTANEEELRVELADLQEKYDDKNREFLELREKSDNAVLQTRMHLDRADREFQSAMCREEERREALEASLRQEFEGERNLMDQNFRERLEHVKEEFAKELKISTQELTEEHQKEMGKQKAKLQHEKDAALQELNERHRKKLAAAEDQMKDIELRQQHDLKDLKAAYDTEKEALDRRDISNANEIEQLHRKCRCLTNLFEEMRMRYERRDPRPEDLREIDELRSRCESQERDLYLLTDRLRDMQIQMSELQQNGGGSGGSNQQKNNNNKQVKKPPPKTIPTSCDVIYEENEERESPPPQAAQPTGNRAIHERNEDDEEEEDEEEENVEVTTQNALNLKSPTLQKLELHGKEHNGKNVNLISEDDSHMISAV